MKSNIFKKALAAGLVIFFLASCSGASELNTVTFDVNTTLQTNAVLPQSVKTGAKVKKPSVAVVGDNPDNYKVYGWYTTKDFKTEWNFKKDTVKSSLTLYAQWKKTYTVTVYGDNFDIPASTETVFEGECIKEHPEYLAGYRYLGSFTDKECTLPFDYKTPITKATTIYMKKSEGIDLYEGNDTGDLYDYLEIYSASDRASTTEVPEIGTISRTLDRSALLVDFGYSPDIGDPFIELSINADITKSRVIHLVMKHYGSNPTLSFYFTTILDKDTYTYSATGKNYTETFNTYYTFKDNEINMTDEDDYIDISIDLAKNSYYNGYSVWGTSNFLGKLRIQSTYISTSPTDTSNKILLKRIYGTNEGYESGLYVGDSDPVKAQLVDETDLPSQPAQNMGFVFPKDASYAVNQETTNTYARKDGLLMYYENEISMRSKTSKTQQIKFQLPTDEKVDVIGDKKIDLNENRFLRFSLKNIGYQTSIKVIVENDYGGKVFKNIKIDARMSQFKEYTINLSKESLAIHTLLSFTFEYESVGVDNAIYVSSIIFEEAKPYDIVGISFDDKQKFGIESNDKITTSYDSSYSAIVFDVEDSTGEVQSSKTDINLCNKGYYGLSIDYSRPKESEIEAVKISLLIDGIWTSYFEFETISYLTDTAYVYFDGAIGGIITNIRFKFVGTGEVRISNLNFEVDDDYCLDLSHDMSAAMYYDWIAGYAYSFNETNYSSELIPDPTASTHSCSFYLAEGHKAFGDLYNCTNLCLDGKTKIVMVYQNRKSGGSIGLVPAYVETRDGNPDASQLSKELVTVNVKGNMKEYEWAYVTVNIPAGYQDYFLGKLSYRGNNLDLSIRLFAAI